MAAQDPAPAAANPPAPASPVPPALEEMRTHHRAALDNAQKALDARELEALRTLEKERVDQADYAGAARVAARIEVLSSALASSTARTAALVLAWSNKAGSSFGIEEKGGLAKMTKADSMLRWDRRNLTPGSYEIRLRFNAYDPPETAAVRTTSSTTKQPARDSNEEPGLGGTVAFWQETSLEQPVRLEAKITPPQVNQDAPRDPNLNALQTLTIGVIEIKSTSATFVLKAITARAAGALKFGSIEFWPTATIQSNEPSELLAAKATYREWIDPKLKPIHQNWIKRLLALEKECLEGDREEELAAVRQEMARVIPLTGQEPPKPKDKYELEATDPLGVSYTGEIRISNAKDCLQRLRRAGDARVSFKLTNFKVPAGTYRVSVVCRTGPSMGGEFHLKCDESILLGTIPQSEGMVERKLEVSGTIKVSDKAKYLDLSVDKLTASEGSLCELKRLELVPVAGAKPSVPATPAPAAPRPAPQEPESKKAKTDL